MNKVYFYGCSHTVCPAAIKETDKYFKYNNGNIIRWPLIVSNYLQLEPVIKAKNGISNDTILEMVLEDLNIFEKDDYIFVQLTHFTRFDLDYVVEGEEMKIGTQVGYDFKKHPVSKEDLHRLIKFADFVNEFGDTINYIRIKNLVNVMEHIRKNLTKNIFLILWEMPDARTLNKSNVLKFNNLINFENGILDVTKLVNTNKNLIKFTITEETNNEIRDMHFGNDGNTFLANQLINFLETKVV